MSTEPRTAFQVLGAAALLGLLGELLFHDAAWGLNIFFWVLALGVGAVGLSKWVGHPIPKVVQFAAPIILVLAACFSLRESVELKWANGAALFLLIGALLVRTPSGTWAQATIYDLTLKTVGAWFKLTSDFAQLAVRDIRWTRTQKSNERLRAIVKGTLIAAPLLIIFGALFARADDAFKAIASRTFSFDWLNGAWLFQTVVIFFFCLIMAAGVYRVILLENRSNTGAVPLPDPAESFRTLGITEIAVVFGLLNALFGLFVLVQAQYFFGGLHHLRTVEGMTFSQYARHGFFELAAVSACALATILGFHSMMREPERNHRSFSILAGILSALVAVVMVSAFQRMELYIDSAGLTQLRVYTTAFMFWIAAVLVWLAATVLRGQRKAFAAGALAAGVLAIFGLNVLNPDATIARFNLSQIGHPMDLEYLNSLSVDAASAVVAGTAHLPTKRASELRSGLRKRWSHEVDTDWRGLNFARWKFLNLYRSEL